ncbi:MAG: ABC transporter ATP-binding protein [Candidatus Nezhaarchaeota archaeon]|nr:ABC transporter ATP-binding protein [Candidatus Nezhaarchaeota archaeon]
MEAVVSRGLWKVYGSGVVALKGVSFNVERGRLVALLGRNGAGKTTWVRVASTQLLPTRGTVEVLGLDVVSEPWMIRELIAMVPQEGFPLEMLTPFEYVYSYLMVRGYGRSEARGRAREYLGLLELEPYADTMIDELSGGLKRRVMVAAVMASGAEVLFLDEPTTGLDPVARRGVWSALKKAKGAGGTIILTTHYMDEAESLADDVVVIHEGRVVFSGSMSQVREGLKGKVRVEVYGDVDPSGYECLKVGGATIFYVEGGEAEEVAGRAIKRGFEVAVKPASLEDLFMRVVGGGIEEGD